MSIMWSTSKSANFDGFTIDSFSSIRYKMRSTFELSVRVRVGDEEKEILVK